jgi:hypothetical protein
MKKSPHVFLTLLAFFPLITFAAVTDVKTLLQLVSNLLGSVMGLLYMVVFVAFFWGISLFILNTDDDAKRAKGKAWMLWSVIALFVLITIWGLIGLLVRTVQVNPLIIPPI